MKDKIVQILKKILDIKENIIEEKIEVPPKKEMWDFAFPTFFLAKELRKNPNIIAQELIEKIEKENNWLFEKIDQAWPYINFFLSKNIYNETFKSIYKKEVKEKHNQKIIIDYIGANVWKPLHIWHMCTPNLWQAIINTYKKLWYDVRWDSHIWDWWIIFWKLIVAYQHFWNEQKLKEDAVEHLFQLYVKITSIIETSQKIQTLWEHIYYILWDDDEKVEEIFIKANWQFKVLDNVKYEWKNHVIPWNNSIEDIYNALLYIKNNNIIQDTFYLDQIDNINKDFVYNITDTNIHSAFYDLSSWDEKYISYWKLFTKESIEAMQKQLDKINVKPDYNIWESFYEWLNLPKLENYPDLKHSMKDIVQELIEKNIATKNEDGSVWVEFENLPSCILAKRNGTHGYLASDLAWIKYRVEEFKADKIIYFVDVRQKLHLQQAFTIAKKAWWVDNTELVHASNGFVKLEDGAMSTRKWKIIKLDKLLDTAIEYAQNILKEKWKEDKKLAEIIWIWAIKYEYLRKNRELDITFKWDEFMTFEWNSAPYIMYTYTRWKSILEKSLFDIKQKINIFNFTEKEEFELIKKLWDYKNILHKTIYENYPHILANYIYELTKIFNSFYANIDVLWENNEQRKTSKLALIEQTVETIKDWFNILGINVPEKM